MSEIIQKNDKVQQLLDEGQKLHNEKKYFDAIKLYNAALIMVKDVENYQLATIYLRLGNAYYELKNQDKYTYYYEKYLSVYPSSSLSSVFSNLAGAYYYTDSDKCLDYHNKALNSGAGESDSINKFFALIKSASYTQEDIKQESEYEVEKIRYKSYRNVVKYNHDDKKANPNKKLNIGYVSSDCYNHIMMDYIMPIWENHDRENFNIFIFSDSEKKDFITDKIKNLGYDFIDIYNMNNENIAKKIYEKQIDILIDISGYTHLKIFYSFYKPAPIMISYLGYLNTLGIKEFDYILTDRYTIPEDKADLYTEKPLYLDFGYNVYRPSNFTDVEDNPFKKNGYITFGSFNCPSKINDIDIYLWYKILEKVENSKLLIYRNRLNKTIINSIKSKFARWNINEDRLIFENTNYAPVYKAYSFADISLDTYPFSGMSIAAQTAIMGLPTVTLAGEGMHSKGAARVNESLGNGDLNANFGEEYIEIAAKLANDKERLVNLRKSLRENILNTPIHTKFKEFTKELEEKYRYVWNEYVNS